MILIPAAAFACAAFFLVADFTRAEERWHFGQSPEAMSHPAEKWLLVSLDKVKDRFLGPKNDISIWEDVCYSMAFHLKAGETSAQTLKYVSQAAESGAHELLKRAFTAYEAGSSLLDAMASVSQNDPRMQSIVGVFQVGAASGADTPALLCGTADLLRKNRLKKREARAKITESRLTAIILTAMPWIIGAYTLRQSSNISSAFLQDPTGRTMLTLAFLLWAIGVAVVWWLIGTAAPRTWDS